MININNFEYLLILRYFAQSYTFYFIQKRKYTFFHMSPPHFFTFPSIQEV